MRILCEEQMKYLESNPERFAIIRRKGYYRLGQEVAIHVGDKIYHGVIENIALLRYAKRYLKFSGFDSLDKWVDCATRGEKNPIFFVEGRRLTMILLIRLKR